MPILGFLKSMFSLSKKACLLYKRSRIVFSRFIFTIYYLGIQGLPGITWGYSGLQGVRRGYRRLEGVTGGYKGLQKVRSGYRGLQRTIETFL